MPVTILVGVQWGDEGKGRVVDWLAQDSDAVARYAGGDNAGHTVIVGTQEFKLHLVPSGVVQPGVTCFMGSGMVINPLRLVSELDMLAGQGVDISPTRIHLSPRAHIITLGHLELDGAAERSRGDQAIGTTQRGIGRAYTDKATRTGILTGAMQNPEDFADAVQQSIARANVTLETRYNQPPIAAITEKVAQYTTAARRLTPYITDTTSRLHTLLEAGKRVLCEGAQGTLLDLDHGHYPYVTSSNATAGGALTGLGFGPRYVDRVVGVTKAYSTRVGSGPFPTELFDSIGDQLRTAGAEFGTTTGRARRCGWLDTVVLQYAARVNGLTELVITKLDVLSGLDELKIATAYELDGERITTLPLNTVDFEHVTPVYETLPGWKTDISAVRHMTDLPENARRYIQRIQAIAKLPISMISVGPEREQAIRG